MIRTRETLDAIIKAFIDSKVDFSVAWQPGDDTIGSVWNIELLSSTNLFEALGKVNSLVTVYYTKQVGWSFVEK